MPSNITKKKKKKPEEMSHAYSSISMYLCIHSYPLRLAPEKCNAVPMLPNA